MSASVPTATVAFSIRHLPSAGGKASESTSPSYRTTRRRYCTYTRLDNETQPNELEPRSFDLLASGRRRLVWLSLDF
jgi:hypothetical protein